MMLGHSLVSVVDDDVSVRESLPDLLRELGYAAAAFSSAEEFLASDCIGQTECLLLDIAIPGISGPEISQSSILPGAETRPRVPACSNAAQ
jgi:FixJ family two-component response regulator